MTSEYTTAIAKLNEGRKQRYPTVEACQRQLEYSRRQLDNCTQKGGEAYMEFKRILGNPDVELSIAQMSNALDVLRKHHSPKVDMLSKLYRSLLNYQIAATSCANLNVWLERRIEELTESNV